MTRLLCLKLCVVEKGKGGKKERKERLEGGAWMTLSAGGKRWKRNGEGRARGQGRR